MSFEDYNRHYGYKAPPPQRGFGLRDRLAYDLKTLVMLGGFLSFICALPFVFDDLQLFFTLLLILFPNAMFYDRFPKTTRWVTILIMIFLLLLTLFQAYASKDLLASIDGYCIITAYAIAVIVRAAKQLQNGNI